MELDDLVLEYLERERLIDTWECFRSERLAATLHREGKEEEEEEHGDPQVGEELRDEEDGARRMQAAVKRDELIKAFEDKAYGRFFTLWDMFDTRDMKQQRQKDSLTFRLQLLFFVNKDDFLSSQEKCEQLVSFLKEQGARIATVNPELYVYFALPHVDEPETKKQFADIYSSSWAEKVASDLALMAKALELGQRGREARLVTIYKEQSNFRTMFENELEASESKVQELQVLSNKLLSMSVKLVHDLSTQNRKAQHPSVAKQAKLQLLKIKHRLEQL